MKSPIALILLSILIGCDSTPPPTFPSGTLIDLTHPFDANTVYWPTASGFEMTTDFEGMTDAGYYYSAYTVSTAEHGGTHLDAPVHFSEGRQAADQVPLHRLIAPAIRVDVSAACRENPDYLITTSDLEAWEMAHGRIPDGSIVLFHTGYASLWPDRAAYMGTDERGPDAVAKLHFPGLDPGAAEWIVANRAVAAVGLDTPSIDRGQSTDFLSHRILFRENIPAFENVASLEALPDTGFFVFALPMKIAGGSGGPLRIVALVPS